MKRIAAWSGGLIAWCAMLCITAPSPAAPPADSSRAADDLLIASTGRQVSRLFSDSRARRSRAVSLGPNTLTKLSAPDQNPIRFNLFDDATFTGTINSIQTRNADSFTATGKLTDAVGAADGDFVIAVQDGVLVANFWSHTRGTFQIRPALDGTYRAQELDAQQFGGCSVGPQHEVHGNRRLPPPPHPAGPNIAVGGPKPGLCDQVIDVMVLYTPRARDVIGSTSAIRALAYASVASTNIAYANSGVSAQVRPVFVGLTEYIEAGDLSIDLARLTTANDGFMDEVPAVRDAVHADMVSLLTGFVLNGSCGVGFVMNTPGPDFQQFAFTVVQQECAVGNLSFAHELGHNLGCHHDHSDLSQGAFPYSHGLRFTGLSGRPWRTAMATGSATRVPIFSNPNILFDGVPTGIPEGQPLPADNARTINNTASVAGAFRVMSKEDCNENGTPDGCDIINGISPDLNENGVPDECDSPYCPADIVTRITPGDPESFDRFGGRVAMSEDRIIVGAELDDDAGVSSGAAYVFRKDTRAGGDAIWVQETKLVASDAMPFFRFGSSVAIAPAGDFVIVGSYRYTSAVSSDVGQAYIYRRTDDFWVLEAKLPNPDPQQAEWFGWAVAMCVDSAGALHAVVTAPLDDANVNDAGAVYVYRRDGSTWNLQTKLIASDFSANSWLGYALAASGDRIIAGAVLDDRGALNSGAAYVFRRHGDLWKQEAKLLADTPRVNDRFGIAVAISGNRALVGAPGDDEKGDRAGAAYGFWSDGRYWHLERKLFAADALPMDAFGGAVSLGGGGGERAVIGAVLQMTSFSASGAAYVFDHAGQSWGQQAKITQPDGASYDNFGVSVCVSPSGAFAVAGAHFDDHHGSIDAGSTSVFPLDVSQPDCNGNGQPDACDIANAVSVDLDGNGIPDECKPGPCSADISAPIGVVNVDDLLVVITHWGPCPPQCLFSGETCLGDIVRDCVVDQLDLNEIFAQWGPCD